MSKAVFCISFVLLMACGDISTPAGTTVLQHSVEKSSNAAITKSIVLAAEPPTQIDVQIIPIQDSQGLRLADVTLTVVDSGGWTVSAAAPGNPINVGSTEVPVMEVPILVSRARNTGCASQASTQMIKVRADGTVTTD